MKHVALRLLLFLLAGAIINVAVAWAIYLTHNGSGDATIAKMTIPDKILPSNETPWWERQFGDHFDLRSHYATRGYWEELVTKRNFARGHSWASRAEAGYPMRCLAVESWPVGEDESKMEHSGITFGRHVLPIQPVAHHFAINTIFYAAIVWMLFVIPGAIRRRVRRKRGQCASCGYSLRDNTSNTCPECGTDQSALMRY